MIDKSILHAPRESSSNGKAVFDLVVHLKNDPGTHHFQLKGEPTAPGDSASQPPGGSVANGNASSGASAQPPPTHYIQIGDRIVYGWILKGPLGDPPKVCFRAEDTRQDWVAARIVHPISELADNPQPEPQARALTLPEFLGAFFPDPDEPIRFRALKPRREPQADNNWPQQKFPATKRSLEEEQELIIRLKEINQRQGIYFVVNSGGDKEVNITGGDELNRNGALVATHKPGHFNACWVENDTLSIAEQHAALDLCPLQPSIRVETKKSVHAYWLLSEPYPGNAREGDWREVQNRLIARFGGDDKIKDPSRVMRLPFFDHLDYNPETGETTRTEVRVHTFDPERRYTFEELLAAFPPAPAEPKATRSRTVAPGQYSSWDALHAELGRRIIARGSGIPNVGGNYDCRGICHNGVGDTGVFYSPSLNRSYCNAGCSEAMLLHAFDLPEKPVFFKDRIARIPSSDPSPSADSSLPVSEISVEAKRWRDPQRIPDGLLPVSELPARIVPTQFRAWIEDIAERMQVPLAFVAIPAIVCFAAVVGNQIRIRPKRFDDWTVVPNLWGAIVGRPGVMKSPPIAEVVRFLYRLQAKATKEHEEALNLWQFQKEAAEVEQAALRDQMKKAAKNKASLDQFRDAFNGTIVPKEPKERRYIVNDVTVEKLGELLAENHRGLLLFRDELTGWLRSLDDERRKNDRAFMLESWNGDSSYTYHRIERGKIEIPNMTVSILGGIQPGPLEVYLRGALGYSEGDDGLLQRLQLSVYPDIQGWKNVDRKPDYPARQAAFDAFEGATALAPEKIGAEFETITEKTEECESVQKVYSYLHFAEEAQEFFDDWYTTLNRDLRSGVFEHPALEAHFSKYRSLMPSLALLFHLCDCLLDEEVGAVSLDAARKAADWCTFLSEHANRIYGLGIPGATIHAKTLAKHIQKGDLAEGFTAREIYATKGWAGLSTAKIVEQALDILESLGWVSSLDVPTGGRPKTQYFINPKIKEVKL